MTLYQIKIIEEAKQELKHEIAYSKKTWELDHSQNHSKMLRDKLKSLAKNPRVYPLQSSILEEIRIFTFKGNRIIYTIIESKRLMVILAITSLYSKVNADTLEHHLKDF